MSILFQFLSAKTKMSCLLLLEKVFKAIHYARYVVNAVSLCYKLEP